MVVKQSKKTSTLLIFSKQTYRVNECTLKYKKFTKMLLKFYNTVIKNEYRLDRWNNIVEVILEKGKGPLINKLRIIQLIKANFQLIIRIFLNHRNYQNIEKDNRLLKFNYNS